MTEQDPKAVLIGRLDTLERHLATIQETLRAESREADELSALLESARTTLDSPTSADALRGIDSVLDAANLVLSALGRVR